MFIWNLDTVNSRLMDFFQCQSKARRSNLAQNRFPFFPTSIICFLYFLVLGILAEHITNFGPDKYIQIGILTVYTQTFEALMPCCETAHYMSKSTLRKNLFILQSNYFGISNIQQVAFRTWSSFSLKTFWNILKNYFRYSVDITFWSDSRLFFANILTVLCEMKIEIKFLAKMKIIVTNVLGVWTNQK